MEEKILDLLAHMYNEIKDMKKNMATKSDIANMATKSDIANMATKSDIANMATKSDIANMATKSDIANMATKSDIANMATKSDIANMATKSDIAEIKENIRRLEGQLLRFENKAENKFNALFDGYKQNTEAIYELRKEVEELSLIVQRHEDKLKMAK